MNIRPSIPQQVEWAISTVVTPVPDCPAPATIFILKRARICAAVVVPAPVLHRTGVLQN